MRFKYIFKDGDHEFAPCCEKSLLYAVNIAHFVMQSHGGLKQIDIYEDDKLIASIYG